MPPSKFAMLCKDLRASSGLKQREVAEIIGVKPGTIGNMEWSPYKVVSRDRAKKLTQVFQLDPDREAQLLAAWDECPLSPEGEKRAEYWAKRNVQRVKSKHHDRLKVALIDLVGIHLMAVPDEDLCTCSFGDPACGLCYALESLGMSRWDPADRDKVFAKLSKIREETGRRAPAPVGK